MGEQEAAPAATEAGSEAAATEATETKPTETVEFWKDKAREQEKRAKTNADAAKRLAEIEDAAKTDLDKANGRATTAETERDDARAEALRLRIAVEHGIGLEDADLFLTGRDEEALRSQAKRLTERDADRKKTTNVVPREGTNTAAKADDERTAVRQLFGTG